MKESTELTGNITIPKQEYYNLRCAQEELELLEAGGVGNWDWYDESLSPDGESLSDLKKKIREEIINAVSCAGDGLVAE